MIDIVKRLRSIYPASPILCDEAAREIERLREEIATLTDRLESVLRDAQASEAAMDKAMARGGL